MFTTMTLAALMGNAADVTPHFLTLLIISVGIALGFRFLRQGKKLVK